jgi:cold shock CspA family protein
MQASVHTIDEETGAGTVVFDDGHRGTFTAEVFGGSGLRHLRVGQRVSIEADGEAITRVWVVGIGDGEAIH